MSKELASDPNEAAADDVLEILEAEPGSGENALAAAMRAHPDADEDTVVAIVRDRRELGEKD